MNRLAIIPARGGSKRIKRKNVKHFIDRPIISYCIEMAVSSNLFNEVMVSTDDNEIAEIAQKYGANVPFFRSKNNASDYATTDDVLIEVISAYREKGKQFDYACCIYPTAVFTSSKWLTQSFDLIIKHKFQTVFSAVSYSHPIQRSFLIDKNKHIKFRYPEYQLKRTQDIQEHYHDAGQFYWFLPKILVENKTLFTKKIGAYIVDGFKVQDIDTMTDWKIAEIKYKQLNHGI